MTTDDQDAPPAGTDAGTAPPPADAPAEEANSGSDPGDAATSGVDEDTDDGPGQEAARYRRRLRATEAERDELAEQLCRTQWQTAARSLAEHGINVELVRSLLGDDPLTALFNESGAVSSAGVRSLVARLGDEYGIVGRPPPRRPRPVPGQGQTGPPQAAAGWADFLTGRS